MVDFPTPSAVIEYKQKEVNLDSAIQNQTVPSPTNNKRTSRLIGHTRTIERLTYQGWYFGNEQVQCQRALQFR